MLAEFVPLDAGRGQTTHKPGKVQCPQKDSIALGTDLIVIYQQNCQVVQSAILELLEAEHFICAFLALRRHLTDPVILKKRATLGINGRKFSTKSLSGSIIKSFYSKA